VVRRILRAWSRGSGSSRTLRKSIHQIAGLKPGNIALYRLATLHRSIAKSNNLGLTESNERLEYLGDAVLGSVVAEYLFKKYPLKDEGFLTEIRSRIVNRDALNEAARKMGIDNIVQFSNNRSSHRSYKSIYGDTLEALVGAVYLDRGYRITRRFIIRKILRQQYDLDQLIQVDTNYKSKIIEWAHQHNKDIRFEIKEVRGSHHNREFRAELHIEGEAIAQGNGFSKKKAEQNAAQKCCSQLQIN
jgi:ribonuclease-3